jgi:hypothetical protein
MKTKYIIVLIHNEQAKPYILHTDKRFHENIIERHRCHVTEIPVTEQREEESITMLQKLYLRQKLCDDLRRTGEPGRETARMLRSRTA